MDFDPPPEDPPDPTAVRRSDGDLDRVGRGWWPPRREPALVLLARERARVEAEPTPIYEELRRMADTFIADEQPEPGRSAAEPRTFDHADGSTYARVPAEELPDGDELDSTSIVDPGAPE